LPHDVVPLPSGGVFYKSKKKAVKVGYLTASDENLLVSAAQNSNSNIVMALLDNKIYEPDLRTKELLESDVEAILIFLRNSSFGSDYNISLKDPKTDKSFQATISLEEFNISKPTTHPDEQGLLSTILPKTEASVKLKPMTYGDKMELDSVASSYPNGYTVPKVTMALERMIVELNGSTDRSAISVFVQNMPIMDSKYIRNFIKNNVPSLELTKNVKAPSGEIVTFDVAFGVEFFRPFF
jgi:hypothetical protein